MDVAGGEECERFRKGMIDQMEQAAKISDWAADPEPDHRQAHVLNAGVGKQAFVIVLQEDKERRKRERHEPKDGQ